MFRWYKESKICYAYLSDVSSGSDEEDHFGADSEFRKSLWFTRGWTLQELLAPHTMIFLDKDWNKIGEKWSLSELISDITGILPNHLEDVYTASVTQKMCWASRRRTTRLEDEAYCLMGIFQVHMPPLYGEGTNAFKRLQLEILKISDDESIFACDSVGIKSAVGLMAPASGAFRNSGSVIQSSASRKLPFTMTHKGLQIYADCIPSRQNKLIFLSTGYR